MHLSSQLYWQTALLLSESSKENEALMLQCKNLATDILVIVHVTLKPIHLLPNFNMIKYCSFSGDQRFWFNTMSLSACLVHGKVIAPVISKRLFILRVQCSSWGEHDGGVQVSNDTRNSASCRDTGLGAFVTRLQCWQYQGHLQHVKHSIRYAVIQTVFVKCSSDQISNCFLYALHMFHD